MADRLTPPASVLVIDDNMDTADSMARFLHVAAGFDVRVAYDGPHGLREAVARPPDAIISDIAMLKIDGLQLAKELKARLPTKPLLIAVTAFAGSYPESKAREAGFDHYLTKPIDPFVLEALIHDHRRARPVSGDGALAAMP